MKGPAILGFCGIVLLGVAGCSTHPAMIKYDSIEEFTLYVIEKQEVGLYLIPDDPSGEAKLVERIVEETLYSRGG